jgi:hypothetical protein
VQEEHCIAALEVQDILAEVAFHVLAAVAYHKKAVPRILAEVVLHMIAEVVGRHMEHHSRAEVASQVHHQILDVVEVHHNSVEEHHTVAAEDSPVAAGHKEVADMGTTLLR